MDLDQRQPLRLEIPVILVAFGFLAMAGLQTVALLQAGGSLTNLRAAQEQPMQQSAKVRKQLDALAGETAKMAEQGNADAKTIIDDLKRQGITVKPAP